MAKKMREYVVNATAGMVAGLVAGTLGGVVGGAVLGLVQMIVTDEGLAACFALFVALIGVAIGVPIGVITGMLKPVICQGTVTKVAWMVVSGLGAGLGARLFYGYDEKALLMVLSVLGAIIAGVAGQCLTLRFRRGWKRGCAKEDDISHGLSPGGFSLGRTRSLCSSGSIG